MAHRSRLLFEKPNITDTDTDSDSEIFQYSHNAHLVPEAVLNSAESAAKSTDSTESISFQMTRTVTNTNTKTVPESPLNLTIPPAHCSRDPPPNRQTAKRSPMRLRGRRPVLPPELAAPSVPATPSAPSSTQPPTDVTATVTPAKRSNVRAPNAPKRGRPPMARNKAAAAPKTVNPRTVIPPSNNANVPENHNDLPRRIQDFCLSLGRQTLQSLDLFPDVLRTDDNLPTGGNVPERIDRVSLGNGLRSQENVNRGRAPKGPRTGLNATVEVSRLRRAASTQDTTTGSDADELTAETSDPRVPSGRTTDLRRRNVSRMSRPLSFHSHPNDLPTDSADDSYSTDPDDDDDDDGSSSDDSYDPSNPDNHDPDNSDDSYKSEVPEPRKKKRRNDKPVVTVQQGIKLESIPPFNPTERRFTINQWINLLQQLGRIYGWNHTNIIYHMQARLRGPARNWYDALENLPITWKSWKKALRETFVDVNNLPTDVEKMRLRVKQKEETYEEYFFAKLQLLRPCNFTPQQQCHYIIDGITDRVIRITANSQNFTKTNDLRQFLLTSGHAFTPKDLKNTSSKDNQNSKDKDKKQNNNNRKENADSRDTRNQSKKMLCFNCNIPGHTSKFCRKPPQTKEQRAENRNRFNNSNNNNNNNNSSRGNNQRNENRSSRYDDRRDNRSNNNNNQFQNNNRNFDNRQSRPRYDNRQGQGQNQQQQNYQDSICYTCGNKGHQSRSCPMRVNLAAFQPQFTAIPAPTLPPLAAPPMIQTKIPQLQNLFQGRTQ